MKKKFVCQKCGYEAIRWLGKCPSCGAWSSFVEEVIAKKKKGHGYAKLKGKAENLADINIGKVQRVSTGLGELDRVLGGGLVDSFLLLLGGDPGIGKSTLMLQVASHLAKGKKVLYVTGEESVYQIKIRAERLKITADFQVLSETNLESVEILLNRIQPDFLIIDSIQSIYHPDVSGAPGSIGQVRECGNLIMRYSKGEGITTILIGHVTKVGSIAGPKTLEHLVDAVLYFEGGRNQQYRIIRSFKNRFGSTNEVGVFEMTKKGLEPVLNPSSIFLSEDKQDKVGSAVIATVEGTRSILIEVQSLCNPTYFNHPQRQTSGIDYRRLILLLAVIEQRLAIPTRQYDIFLNVVGGIKIDEPAADLGIVLAVASAIRNKPIPKNTIFIGEVGLGGEVRPVVNIETRIREAEKLGFQKCVIPPAKPKIRAGIELITIRDVKNGAKLILGN